MNDTWDKYERCLIQRLGLTSKASRYKHLFDILHTTWFHYVIDGDSNRVGDAQFLRRSCASAIGLTDYASEDGWGPWEDASVLEVLAALAIRIDTEYTGDPGSEHPGIIFWEMLENLDLTYYDDSRWGPIAEQLVQKILRDWMDRDFDYDGFGSIFPVRGAAEDQRKLDMWEQMLVYISQK